MVKFFIHTMVLIFLATSAHASDRLVKDALEGGLEPIPAKQKKIMKLIGNPDGKMVELGKKLYFDPRLSKSGLISCNTCHNLATGGVDGVSAAIGHKWTENPHHLNSPTVLNSVFNAIQMWDGRFADLEEQAMGPMQAAPEMASTPELVVKRLSSIPEYIEEFKSVFPEERKPITFENVAKAIAAFERTLVTPSKFDDFMNGDPKALSDSQKKGLAIFLEKGCANCHNGIGIGGGSMQPFPLVKPYKHDKIGDFKGDRDGAVKVPLLRNVTRTAPYFHNGAVWTIEEAVKTMGETQLGVDLTEDEIKSIVSFLGSLEGRLPSVTYPVLPSSTADTPRPEVKD